MPDDGSVRQDTPDNPLTIPRDKKQLLKVALETIEICRTSVGSRSALCRQLNTMIETGRSDGARSRINKLYSHVDRLASHLFSPTHLRFSIDFENHYPENQSERAQVAARLIDHNWERQNTDMKFGLGVRKSLDFGCSIFKQWCEQRGSKNIYNHSLVMPWQFGVYREDVNELSKQPAFVETSVLTYPEVWRRIWYLPDAHNLYKRIVSHGTRGSGGEEFNSFFHNVLSTSQLDTTGTAQAGGQPPGGIVQMNNDPNYSIVGPQVIADVVKMHELWMWDDEDWGTIQIIEPDIIIFPKYKKGNLLIAGAKSGLHPYTKIQPNVQAGYFWGRSEVTDLMALQMWLSTTADDIHRLFGLQVDKILAFSGFDGVTDETYDQMRGAGFFNGPPGASVSDLTPQFPPQSLQIVEMQMKLIDNIGGFDNILSGSGEAGVRAAQHADMLLKTAAPRLRDRALITERQCAEAADLTLSLMQAKDGKKYWIDGRTPESMEETSFLLSDIPADRRVSIDSHSTSPIFADDHENTIAFGVKAGLIDGEDAIDLLPYIPPGYRELLKQKYRDRQAAQAQTLENLKKTDPEAYAKVLSKK